MHQQEPGPGQVRLRFLSQNTMRPVYFRRLEAQALVEFGLLLALVAVVAIAGLLIFGGTVSTMMSTLSTTVALNIAP